MPKFRTELVTGDRSPYDTWAFAVVPEAVRQALGGGARIAVRGEVAGAPFRSTIQRGEGVYRFPVTREVRDAAGVDIGDRVEITLEADSASREVAVPAELRAVLAAEGLTKQFAALPPSHRRAWSQHVAEAQQAETRRRRAAKAPAAIRGKLFPGQR